MARECRFFIESSQINRQTNTCVCLCSFSWLSWQVHRSLAILIKGSAVTPFHQEFHRLYFSSKPVPSFVTFITVPHTLALYTTSHATQNNNSGICKSKSSQTKTMCHWDWIEDVQYSQTKTKLQILSNPESPELEHSKGNNQLPHKSAIDEQKHTKPPQLYPKPMVQRGTQQSESVEKPKHTAGGVSTLHDVQTYVEPLEKHQNQIQSHTKHLGQTQVSNIQSQLAGLSVSTTAEKNTRVQELNPLHTAKTTHQPHRTVRYQSTLKKNSSLNQVGTEEPFFQQRNENRSAKPSGITAGPYTQRGQWNYTTSLKPQVELLSENPKLLSPSISQQKQAKTGLQVRFSHLGQHPSGLEPKASSLGTKRHCQQPLQSHPTTDAPGFKLAPTTAGTHLKPQLHTDSKMYLTGATVKQHLQHLQPHTSQQAKPPPRLNWMPQSHTVRARPVARTSSFDTTYGTGQKTAGRLGWRPFHSNMTSLGRSKSLNERRTMGLNPNITTI